MSREDTKDGILNQKRSLGTFNDPVLVDDDELIPATTVTETVQNPAEALRSAKKRHHNFRYRQPDCDILNDIQSHPVWQVSPDYDFQNVIISEI